MTSTNTGTNAFWEFSLAFYARDGVPEACLQLQDDCGVDVNLLLYCLWRGWRGDRIDAAEVDRVNGAIVAWRDDVVLPVRALRRQLRDYPDIEATRSLIKQAELQAEREQQARMFALTPATSSVGEQRDCIEQALAVFAQWCGLSADANEPIGALIRQALEDQELAS